MVCWLLAESAGHFWWPAEFENVAKSDFENLKHLQNPGHLPLTAASMLIVDNLIIIQPPSMYVCRAVCSDYRYGHGSADQFLFVVHYLSLELSK